VSQFLENARQIFEAAENSALAGYPSEEYTILVSSTRGNLYMVANSDWSLGSLQEEHGAQLAYRVSRANGHVTVDGRDSGHRTCRMEGETPNRMAQFLLNAAPAWHGTASYPGLLA
jgi:hypothetical protein